MDIAAIARMLLRLAHAIAAALWLGGGAYYVLALRPALRSADPAAREVGRAAQAEFGEWASVATIVLIATGVVMSFDRLTNGQGSSTYVVFLGIKIVAAISAFWLTGTFVRNARRRQRQSKTWINRSWIILTLGTIAFVIGVALSVVYPTGISG